VARLIHALPFACALFASALSGAVEVRSDVEYKRASGEAIRLDAHIPEGVGPFAAVILVHGGGWTVGDKRVSFIKPLFPTLDDSGFAWFSIDYRLAPKHPYPAAVEDVQDAIAFVKAHARDFRIDPNRIALMGESAGGHLVALVGAHPRKGSEVAAVVPFYGAFDIPAMLKGQEKITGGFKDFFQLSEMNEQSRATLREASAATYVKRGMPPFLLIHGTADKAVPYDQSVKFCEQLKAAGNRCELYTVPNGIHGVMNWEKNPEQHAYKDVMVKWLRNNLK
jgi:acetyl esterase